MGFLTALRDTNLVVHVLVALFGIGSWLDINGVWVELPILVGYLPEGWNLGSYLVVIISVANIGPLLYTIGHLLAPGVIYERPIVYVILGVGAVACLLLAFLWRLTTFVGGVEHSTPLLALNFFLGTVDCTSSIVFLTFMSFFKTPYMTSYFIGEGLSGLLPSLVALGQGVGELECNNVASTNATFHNGRWFNETTYSIEPSYLPPRFPPRDFFLFLFAMMVVSFISFTLLNVLPLCKREQVSSAHDVSQSGPDGIVNPAMNIKSGVLTIENEKSRDTQNAGKPLDKKFIQTHEDNPKVKMLTSIGHCEFALLLVLTGWLNGLGNGVLPSLQSYACLPYGSETYHLAVTLAQIANPMSCFVAFFLSASCKYILMILTLLASGVAAYVITVAALSPTAVLLGEAAGPALAVFTQVLVVSLITYTKVSIATVFRKQGRRALLWYGAISQVGSLIGAVATFVLINVLFLLESAPACPLEVEIYESS